MFSKTIIIGNVGRDPELHFTGGGTAVLNFTVAVNSSRKVNDEWMDETTWFKITAWGKFGESIYKLLRKGQQVVVEGSKLSVQAYLDKENKPQATLNLTAENIRILGKLEKQTEDDDTSFDGFQTNKEDVPF